MINAINQLDFGDQTKTISTSVNCIERTLLPAAMY